MHFLVTNDDGIHSEGLHHLVKFLMEIGKVTVVAPDIENSAKSQAITLNRPIEFKSYQSGIDKWKGFSVNGTPSDCIKLAISRLLTTPPDWVISGINQGDNLGQYVYYSGTVGAAVEGVLHGIPSIAISASKSRNGEVDFENILSQLHKIFPKLFMQKLPKSTLINCNLTYQKSIENESFKICPLNQHDLRFRYHDYLTPKESTAYWLNRYDMSHLEGTDLYWNLQGFSTITPIHIMNTSYEVLTTLERIL